MVTTGRTPPEHRIGRRGLLAGFVLASFAGCIGGRNVDAAIEDGLEAVTDGFDILDPDGVTSIPFDHRLAELETTLPDAVDQLNEAQSDADDDTRADLELLAATARTQLQLTETYRGLRTHAEAYTAGLETILEEPTDPSPATASFDEALEIMDATRDSVDAAATTWAEVDVGRLTELGVEPTFDGNDIDELAAETAAIYRLTELVAPLPVGVAAMEFATDAYETGAYDDAADRYDEATTAFEPAAAELATISSEIDRHPDRSTTEGFAMAAEQATHASDQMAAAARAHADGDADGAAAYEADAGLEELPPSWQPDPP